ncbi:MAG TPA: hypothetical protein VG096_20440 [Bryobacteraceae bacterium]|jgi:hypothetical protein|nr:hypothetical protein [Bryobacteraceae bacterium]
MNVKNNDIEIQFDAATKQVTELRDAFLGAEVEVITHRKKIWEGKDSPRDLQLMRNRLPDLEERMYGAQAAWRESRQIWEQLREELNTYRHELLFPKLIPILEESQRLRAQVAELQKKVNREIATAGLLGPFEQWRFDQELQRGGAKVA